MKQRHLLFFGSDRYGKTVLDQLRLHSDLQVTHFSDLASFIKGPMVKWFNGVIPLGLSASFPYLFPPEIITQFNGLLYNLHPSLLPQYRNVAPVPYALAMGDQVTGITLQKIDAKIDHGEIVAQLKEPILPTDTTTTLLHRLFTKGAELFFKHLITPSGPGPAGPGPADTLIFTRKLTGQSGYLEWPVVLKLIHNQPITADNTTNPLINLRLTHHPDRTHNILPDLIRALTGYEKVWTLAPTKKGDLRISFAIPQLPATNYQILVLVPGKPRPISWSDFAKYYL